MKIPFLLALLLFLLPASATADCIELIDFEIEDQFENDHTEDELLGSWSVLVWADREGKQYSDAWEAALREAFAGYDLEHRAVAHVEGVPGWIPGLKGRIRGSFSEDPERWALLDWDGRFAEAYDPTEEQVTVFVFDDEGCLRTRVSGTEPEPVLVDALLEAVPAP